MELKDILRKDLMILNLEEGSKTEIIETLIKQLIKNNLLDAKDQVSFVKTVLDREKISSTGLGDGIAIPHGMSEVIKEPVVVYGYSDEGLEFESMDGKPAHHFFLIATPKGDGKEHLTILAELSRQLMNQEVIEKLNNAKNEQAVVDAFSIEEKVAETSDLYDIVAVTGCATGIAHTYMAAEKLSEVAKAKGIKIKVETNGSSGVENALTQEEIKAAKGIIVAADIQVAMARFNGKKLVKTPVAEAIKSADKLIDQILEDKASVYHATTEDTETSEDKSGLYQHLMSGVSHMLPFVIGGGILIAIAFMVDQLLGVPQAELGSLGSYNSLAAFINNIGGTAFSFMLPVLAGYIAMSIADRPGLVVGFVAGGLASSGGSGFLGALLGGFVAGYTMNFVRKALKNLPETLAGIRTVLLYPVLGVFIAGTLVSIINIPMSSINETMNNFLNSLSGSNAILLGLIVGAMMAVDLGGPINKAAYVFGTGTLAATVSTGGSSVMAAVMAAGMVPPLAIFIATRLFPKKFTKDQNQAGFTNLILGLSFITEGAIPFASADPIPMLVSFIGGSAVASALVMALNIKVLAPHGGIFVIMLVSSPILYLGAILAGSIVSAALIGVLKK